MGAKGPGSKTTQSRLHLTCLRTKLISASATFPPHVLTLGHGQSQWLLWVITAKAVLSSELTCRRKQSNEIPWGQGWVRGTEKPA